MSKIEKLIKLSKEGNAVALESLIIEIQDDVYYLSLRMLADPNIAKDATQEIIIKVITNLSTFEGRSKFKTWVYTISKNYLFDTLKKLSRDPLISFDEFREDLEQDLEGPGDLYHDPSYALMLNEVRIGCTMGMLLGLNAKHRIAYILGDIFELDHNEASAVLEIKEATYRKQLERARKDIYQFMGVSCGLVSKCAKCSCSKKLSGAIARGRVNPKVQHFAGQSKINFIEIESKIKETQEELRGLALQTAIPRFVSPEHFGKMIEGLIKKGF